MSWTRGDLVNIQCCVWKKKTKTAVFMQIKYARNALYTLIEGQTVCMHENPGIFFNKNKIDAINNTELKNFSTMKA